MKKAIFILPDLGSGGAERVVSILCAEFIKKGAEVDVIMMLGGRIQYDFDKSIKCHNLNLLQYSFLKRIGVLRCLLKSLLKGNSKTAIFAFHDSCLNYTLAASVGLNVKIISSERNNPYRKGTSLWSKIKATIPYALSSCIVFQTVEARKYYGLLLEKKCRIIPNPIVCSDYLWRQNISPQSLISVCRLHEQKNIPMTLDVIRILKTKIPQIHLDIYGEGDLKKRIEKMIIEKDIKDNVSLCGTTKNVTKVLSEHSVFISTSDFEGISNSMLEAMSVGMPIICTNCPIGGAELMLSDGAGILTPVKDVTAFTDELYKILSDRQLAIKLGKTAYEKSLQFSPEKIAESWYSLID